MTQLPCVTAATLTARILPILDQCEPNLRAAVAAQLVRTGQFVPPYGPDALFKLVRRGVNDEFVAYLQDLNAHPAGNSTGVTTKELRTFTGNKRSSDGVPYGLTLGCLRITGRIKGQRRYALTAYGRRVARGQATLPLKFVYMAYAGHRHLLAVSYRRIQAQSGLALGASHGPFKPCHFGQFHLVRAPAKTT